MKRIALPGLLLLAACEGHPGSLPLPFVLLTPADGLGTLTTTPTFTWNASGRAVSYRLQIATVSDFSALTQDLTGIASPSFALVTPLADGTVYFWRVLAQNEKGDTPSASLSFGTTVLPGNPPAAFTQTDPADLLTGVALVPIFKWAIAPGADSYTIEVATDAAFVSIVVNQTLITQTSFACPITLTASTVYFWRVTAVNVVGGTIAGNAPTSFTTTP